MIERTTYRIIDANYNRAREALRTVEDYCRFTLNSTQFYDKAKELRHKLSGVLNRLDYVTLLVNRDTRRDVGINRSVESQLSRIELRDCFIAGCKRLTEALRTIAEYARTIDSSVADDVENIRYAAYTFEKDVILFSDASNKFENIKLYVIITSDIPVEIISLTTKCTKNGADCIQLRTKNVKDESLFAVAEEFVKICKGEGVYSVINDRVDIAVATGADGIHLGKNDVPVQCAKKLQLSPLIIGKTTHSLEQIRNTIKLNPTYVSLGPIFATETKPGLNPVGLNYIQESLDVLNETAISHVAIGGITLDNIDDVLKAGAKCIAVCSAITQSEDPAKNCRAFKEKIESSLDMVNN
jgi:thiamine-phosphate pyrophosphorylase